MNHYERLGVARDATVDQIKKAFRKKAQKAHPDRNGGNEEEFKALAIAYDILGSKEKKHRYDTTGDDKAPPSLDQRAEKNVMGMVDQYFAAEDELPDIIKWLKQRVGIDDSQCKSQIAEGQKNIKRLEKRLKRLTGPAFVKAIAESRITSIKEAIKQLEERLEMNVKAIEIIGLLKDNGMELDPDIYGVQPGMLDSLASTQKRMQQLLNEKAQRRGMFGSGG